MCMSERRHPVKSRLLLGVIAVKMMLIIMILLIMTAKATVIFRRCAQIKKFRNHLKILGARRVP
jgi:hypothetical protein